MTGHVFILHITLSQLIHFFKVLKKVKFFKTFLTLYEAKIIFQRKKNPEK